MLGSSLLQDVAGISSLFPPPPGDVDFLRVSFADLNPSLPVNDVCFTVFASSNDSLVFVDTVSSLRTTYGSPDILPLTRCVPDSSSALVNLGVLGVVALGSRFRKMGVH
jgi:hypothetical protein